MAIAGVNVDSEGLAGDLERQVAGEVRFDAGSRGLYSTGGSNYRQVPIGVVIPRDIDDIVATVATCRDYGAPVLGRGGGTSLAGQCCNVGVVIDTSKYLNEVLDIDPERKRARVQPGVYLDALRDRAEQHHLTFGPDPSTHTHCALGGMIGNNSCGVHSVLAGRTSDNVEELEILTYDGLRMRVGPASEDELERIIAGGGRRGEIYAGLRSLRDRYADLIRARYPDIPRRVSGYNLDDLLPENGFHVARALSGTESTCVLYLDATVRLVDSPRARSLVVLGYPSVYEACDHIPEIMGFGPMGLEGIDDLLTQDMVKKDLHPQDLECLPDGNGWLLVEFGGDDDAEADGRARAMMDALKGAAGEPSVKLFDDPDEAALVWEIRESGLGATAWIPGGEATWEGWEDAAVPPARLGEYLRDFRELLNSYDYECSLYGHFGQGCVHTRIDFDFRSKRGIEQYRKFVEEAADLVVGYGGSLSGEHGDGQSRAELLPKMFGDELVQAFREFKAIWDPGNKMNPGKVVEPYRIDENLRLGADFNPPVPKTHFAYTNEGGSFVNVGLRCVGVGKCRRDSGGVMCPSYMVTREEKHSTRGRAHLLFEMLEGDPVANGWRDDNVKEALDLCLACKGCKNECPVDVDMATYKAEFFSHYYKRRLRPRPAYAMGLIYWWARMASRMPRLVNGLTHSPVLGTRLKKLAGLAPEREAPEFAGETFRDWFERRPRPRNDNPPVVLWADTFNNFFHPDVGKATVEVLEAAGYRVDIPPRILCCGRPLYDYGMLTTAKYLLRQVLQVMEPYIVAGVPVVGMEPSCTAVFRDELTELFPYDENAKRLRSEFYTLAEFLELAGYDPPELNAKAVLHGHCHHKSIMHMDADERLLRKIGVDYDFLDSGCCGLAGSFGFEAGDNYEVSVAAGERVLLPAVRTAAHDTLIVTDGFSCHTQIEQLSDRRPLHLAQVLQLALHQSNR